MVRMSDGNEALSLKELLEPLHLLRLVNMPIVVGTVPLKLLLSISMLTAVEDTIVEQESDQTE